MFGLLALLFVVVPILELYVIVQVAQGVGVLPTVIGVIVVSAVGAWLCKREGVGLFQRIQRQLNAGQLPTDTVVEGFLVLFAGALLLTPGFVTDLVGLVLLLPPVRAVVRRVLLARFAQVARRRAAEAVRSRTRVVTFGFGEGGTGGAGFDRGFGGRGFRDGAAAGGRVRGPGPYDPTANSTGRGRVIDVGEASHGPAPRSGPAGDGDGGRPKAREDR